VGSVLTGIEHSNVSYLWAALLVGVVSTQSLGKLSQVASVLVLAVFASFAGILLPGLAQVSDPLAVLGAGPAESADVMSSVLHMAPVVVTTLVFQNIVPTVTRILDYDKAKTMAAITIGSMIPLIMYLAWCVAVLGGGIDTTSFGASGPLMTVFSIVTVGGSSIGTLMSLSEEFEILLGQDKKDTFSLPSVAVPVGIALLACQAFSSDINSALKMAGSFGSPLLYGLIPVAMAWTQQQKAATSGTSTTKSRIIPGAGLAALGLGATALVGAELVENVGHLL
jgi:tyrosine-specific transport protein